MVAIPDYAELQCVSNFSFLRGASQPEELVERAKQLGYTALALTGECSMSGIVRAHTAAKQNQLKLLVGSQFRVDWGGGRTVVRLTVLACNLQGYGNLCQFIALRRCAEGQPPRISNSAVTLADCVVWPVRRMSAQLATARWLLVTSRSVLAWCRPAAPAHDEMWLHRLREGVLTRFRWLPPATSFPCALAQATAGRIDRHARRQTADGMRP
jgi:error-prone DNA polymerase